MVGVVVTTGGVLPSPMHHFEIRGFSPKSKEKVLFIYLNELKSFHHVRMRTEQEGGPWSKRPKYGKNKNGGAQQLLNYYLNIIYI